MSNPFRTDLNKTIKSYMDAQLGALDKMYVSMYELTTTDSFTFDDSGEINTFIDSATRGMNISNTIETMDKVGYGRLSNYWVPIEGPPTPPVIGLSWYATIADATYEMEVTSSDYDADGNLYVMGLYYTNDWVYPDYSENYIFILKYDPAGNFVWDRRYRETTDLIFNYETLDNIKVGIDGNLYCTYQYEQQTPSSLRLIKMIKISSSTGSVLWEETLIDPTRPVLPTRSLPGNINVDADGNTYVVKTATYLNYYGNIILLKYNSSNTLQWIKEIGASDPLYAAGNPRFGNPRVCIDSVGDVYVCATHRLGSDTSLVNTSAIIKVAPAGTIIWQRKFNGSSVQNISIDTGMAIDQNDDIIVAAHKAGQIIVSKVSSTGSLQWVKEIGDGLSELLNSVTIGPDNSIYTDYEVSGTGSTVGILKLTTDGDLVWGRSFGEGEGLRINNIGDNIHVYNNTVSLVGWQTNTSINKSFVLQIKTDGSDAPFGGAYPLSVITPTVVTNSTATLITPTLSIFDFTGTAPSTTSTVTGPTTSSTAIFNTVAI